MAIMLEDRKKKGKNNNKKGTKPQTRVITMQPGAKEWTEVFPILSE